jgi:O-antigen/teichoic acid export membrane protein
MIEYKPKSDTKKIIANMAWMIFDKVFLLLLNLLVIVKIANYYKTEIYGSYQYVVSIVAIFEILVNFVDGRVVKKEYDNYDAENVVYNATLTRLLFSALSMLVGAFFILINKGSHEFSLMFGILLFNSVITSLRFGMANRFEYLLKSKKVVIAADIAAVISLLLQLVAVRMKWSIVAITVIVLISSVISLIIVFIQYKMEFGGSKIHYYVDRNLLLNMIKESVPLAIAASCAIIYTRCDSVMIGNLLSVSDVGIYSIAVRLISVVQIAIGPIRESIYPKLIQLYRSDKTRYIQVYIQATSVLTWIYIIGVLISLVILPYVFRFLNPEYANSFDVYKIYVIGTFFMYNAALRAGHFTLINRGIILTYSQVISVVLNIVLNLFLINKFGLYGAALATVITQAVSLMFSNLFFKKDGCEVFKWQLLALNPFRMLPNYKDKLNG